MPESPESPAPSAHKMAVGDLPLWRKLAYGVGDLCGGTNSTVLGFYYNFFLLNVARIEPVYVGIILLFGRVIEIFLKKNLILIDQLMDSVSDPLIGVLTDRTKSSMVPTFAQFRSLSTPKGRRRPWLLFGAPVLAITFICCWWVPDFDSDTSKFVYFLLFQLILSISFTSVALPYATLTSEISESYSDRTSLTMYRFIFSILGAAVAALSEFYLISEWGYRDGFLIGGIIWGLIGLVALWTTFAFTKEIRLTSVQQQPQLDILEGIRIMFSNKAFLSVIAVHTLAGMSLQLYDIPNLL